LKPISVYSYHLTGHTNTLLQEVTAN